MVTVEELLEEPAIEAYLHRMIGDEGMGLVRRFPDAKEFSDEELAELTEINLNSVRNTLYTLYEHRLAKYRRIKNNETGWLTYLWHLQPSNIYEAIARDMDVILEKLKKRYVFENENDFYTCRQCGYTTTFTSALDNQFVCPSCEDKMTHFDNELLVVALSERIARMKDTLGHA
ncbi:MAG TPA: transcription factor [Methanospirillum sp.]|nr:transcription factor [Methanospirillum sp.]